MVRKYDSTGTLIGPFDSETSAGEPEVAIDLSNDHVYVDHRTYINEYDPSGALIDKFGEEEGGSGFPGSRTPGASRSRASNHMVYAMNENGKPSVDTFLPTGPITIPTVTTGAPGVEPTAAVLHGVVNGDGVDTTDCEFEWGLATGPYEHVVECSEGRVFAGASGDHPVSASISGLTKGTTYHYRITAKNANNVLASGAERIFAASGKPLITGEGVSKINTDGVQFNITVDPNGGITKFHVDWGTEAGVYGHTFPIPDRELLTKTEPESFNQLVNGLAPNTEYHYRVTAANDAGPTVGPDRSFKTFPPPPPIDPCHNALVRKQTGASLLLDCRAYELVSAADQGGYDVESNLLAGQAPLVQPPGATDRVLYSLHYGALPGFPSPPTNFGHDPYVAIRGEHGWSTRYVGLPSGGLPSLLPFGSPLAGFDAALDTFAFGGEKICQPCFPDGSTNMPVRLPDGSLSEGMAGSENPGPADPAGQVTEPFSDNGSHFVFGSEKRFEPTGNSGSLSLYDRNLISGATQVVSTTPAGTTMSGPGIAELGISADGSRILIGKLVATDAKGNQYFDLYMHVGNDPHTVTVAETDHGVLYNGMTADGGQVLFTTVDKLADDTDASADLFRADVGTASSTVSRVSSGTGGTGNTDACTPEADWNAVGGAPSCGTVAIAGGGGVASGDGTAFFLSPELLDGGANGIAGEPNLYVAHPGQAPHFVATIDSGLSNPLVKDAVEESATRRFGDFQVTPDGGFAAFSATRSINGAVNHGHYAVYRYDAAGAGVECVSCGPSGTDDTRLSESGLNLTNDGRVFFTTTEQFVLRDTNEADDAYEYEDGITQLISSGTSPTGSSLLAVSGDGRDAYFFTRDTLSPEDLNGSPMKIYDARAEGGFLYSAPPFPCAASDECHGPGTQAAEPPTINTVEGSGRAPNPGTAQKKPACGKGKVRKHGKCVKRKTKKHDDKKGRGR